MISHSKPWLTQNDIQSVNDCLNSGNIATGALGKQFRDELGAYLEFDYAYHLSNGTTAIYVALKALGVVGYDEVVLPTYVCKNVKDAVLHIGAIPVLCDIGIHWCMTEETVATVITKKTKAIIIVHPLGIYCEVKQFKKFGLPIIEDCCQAFSKEVGLIGDVAVYSFNATKCLSTGEGGAICTNDDTLSVKLDELFRNKSMANPLSDLQSALGLSQLRRYDETLAKREYIAKRYFEGLPKELTSNQSKVKSMFFRFLLTSDTVDFEQLKTYATDRGVAVRKGVDTLLHDEQSIIHFPNAEQTLKRTISIPIYPSMTGEDVDQVINSINSYEYFG